MTNSFNDLKNKVGVITGGAGVIGTALAHALGSAGIKTAGILSPGRYLSPGKKEFDLELVPGGKKYFLSSRNSQPEWKALGNFWFNTKAVEAGLRHLTELKLQKSDLYILDEVGPFELNGLIWAPAIPDLMDKGIPMIWTLRQSILDQACKKWKLADPNIVHLSETEDNNSLSIIHTWIKENVHNYQLLLIQREECTPMFHWQFYRESGDLLYPTTIKWRNYVLRYDLGRWF